MRPLAVLFEDNHLIVVNKPAGLPTMGVAPGDDSLHARIQDYWKQKYHKPGNVYVGVVSRLDAFVSGVVVFARTSKAAARLTQQFQTRQVEKTYWAIVEGRGVPAQGVLENYLAKNEAAQRMESVPAGHPPAQLARLSYTRLAETAAGTWVEVQLETGRKHQIRVQFTALGHPVLGDRKYGATHSFPHGIALHSRQLRLQHPVTKAELEFTADLPDYWPRRP